MFGKPRNGINLPYLLGMMAKVFLGAGLHVSKVRGYGWILVGTSARLNYPGPAAAAILSPHIFSQAISLLSSFGLRRRSKTVIFI
jgi:hypothetical protein